MAPRAGPRPADDASKELLASLRKSALAARPAPGLVKCPTCGADVEPTRNGRVRVHTDPLAAARCVASGRPWRELGKRARQRPARRRAPA